MEMPGATPATVQEFVRDQQAIADRRRRGLLTAAAGIGIILFLIGKPGPQIYTIGMIPVVIGSALLAYAYLLVPRA